MSRMSELHDDLSTIHAILLGQRGVAQDAIIMLEDSHKTVLMSCVESLKTRVACIDDLLLEFEAAGVVWPDNVVTLHG